MPHVLVFDATAIVALLDSHPTILDMVERADKGWLSILVPACAVGEAVTEASASPTALDVLAFIGGVIPLDLTVQTAASFAGIPGDLATQQVIHTASTYFGDVVTNAPDLYPEGTVPLAVF